MPTRKIQRYGWKPDLPDHRDFTYSSAKPMALPPSVDLRGPFMPAVWDQGQLGSCTAHAIAAAVEFDIKRQKASDFMPSRLFIYYNERAVEGDIGSDNGAQIRDGVKATASLGVPHETLWPYSDANPGPFSVKPSANVFADALKHKVTSYMRVTQTAQEVKHCLASGFPVVFGFSVYEAFESDEVAKTGILNMPAPTEKAVGGHAVLCVGYNDHTKMFLVRNSWGADWGQQGYFWMPYTYMLNPQLADDLWTIRAVMA